MIIPLPFVLNSRIDLEYYLILWFDVKEQVTRKTRVIKGEIDVRDDVSRNIKPSFHEKSGIETMVNDSHLESMKGKKSDLAIIVLPRLVSLVDRAGNWKERGDPISIQRTRKRRIRVHGKSIVFSW